MRILLAANLMRLQSSKLFWAGNLFMFAYGIYDVLHEYRIATAWQRSLHLDDLLCGHIFFIGIVTAIFVSLFLGTEYGDGTLRNKLIVGHLRYNVYFADLAISVIALSSMALSYMLATLLVGIPLLGGLQMAVKDALPILIGSFLLIATFCAIYTMIALCCDSKTVTIAVSITGAFVFFLITAYIGSMLTIPDYWIGAKRTFLNTIFDLLPSGQAYQYMALPIHDLYQKIAYNGLVIFITTFIGQLVFARKNIK